MTGKGAAVAWSNAVSVDVHRGLVSCTRAPLNMPSTLRAFPSWQAYSYIGSPARVNGAPCTPILNSFATKTRKPRRTFKGFLASCSSCLRGWVADFYNLIGRRARRQTERHV